MESGQNTTRPRSAEAWYRKTPSLPGRVPDWRGVGAIGDGHADLLDRLKRYHLLESIGDEHIYPTNRHAVAAYRDEYDIPSQETGPAQKGSDDE